MPRDGRLSLLRRIRGASRKSERDFRRLPRSTLDPDTPAVSLDDGIDDCHSEAEPSDGGVGDVGAVKFIEDSLCLLGGHADPLVADRDQALTLGIAEKKAEATAGGGVLDGIAQQIFENLADLGRIRRCGRPRQGEIFLETMAGRGLMVMVDKLSDQGGERAWPPVEGDQATRFDAAEVEEVFDAADLVLRPAVGATGGPWSTIDPATFLGTSLGPPTGGAVLGAWGGIGDAVLAALAEAGRAAGEAVDSSYRPTAKKTVASPWNPSARRPPTASWTFTLAGTRTVMDTGGSPGIAVAGLHSAASSRGRRSAGAPPARHGSPRTGSPRRRDVVPGVDRAGGEEQCRDRPERIVG